MNHEEEEKSVNQVNTGSIRKPLPKASLFKSYNNLHQFGAPKQSMSAYDSEGDEMLTTGPDFAETAQAAAPAGKNGLNATIMLPWL